MKKIINIFGTPKSFTSTTYDFLKNAGMTDVIEDFKEGCYYFDHGNRDIKGDGFFIDGSMPYAYKPAIYKKIKNNLILYLDYQKKTERYFSQLQMNFEFLDESFSYTDSIKLINEYFVQRINSSPVYRKKTLNGFEHLHNSSKLKNYSVFDILFNIIFTAGKYNKSKLHFKKRKFAQEGKFDDFVALELEQLRSMNWNSTFNIMPVQMSSWTLEEAVKNFRNIFYISFFDSAELHKKLIKFLDMINYKAITNKSISFDNFEYVSAGEKSILFPRVYKDKIVPSALSISKIKFLMERDSLRVMSLLNSENINVIN